MLYDNLFTPWIKRWYKQHAIREKFYSLYVGPHSAVGPGCCFRDMRVLLSLSRDDDISDGVQFSFGSLEVEYCSIFRISDGDSDRRQALFFVAGTFFYIFNSEGVKEMDGGSTTKTRNFLRIGTPIRYAPIVKKNLLDPVFQPACSARTLKTSRYSSYFVRAREKAAMPQHSARSQTPFFILRTRY